MKLRIGLSAVVVLASLALNTAIAQEQTPVKVGSTSKGPTLVDAKGMTLYTFDKDSDGKSACNGPCAGNWPALKADGNAKSSGGYTVVKRDDGTMQWAYKGKPLYTWVKDTKPGDTTGDGFLNGAWHVAQP
jgi:predicted lipoprotein with Yx(FWY)xxD motif